MLWNSLITFKKKDLPAKKFTTVWKDLTSTKYFGILSIFTHFSAPTLNLPTWNFPSCTIHHTPLVWGTESTATNGKLQLTWTCLAPLAKPRIIARKLARIIVKGERSLFTEKAVHLSVFSIITQARGGKKRVVLLLCQNTSSFSLSSSGELYYVATRKNVQRI